MLKIHGMVTDCLHADQLICVEMESPELKTFYRFGVLSVLKLVAITLSIFAFKPVH